MKLHSIAISNFRVIRRAELRFPDQVIGITGPNGAGKSSIVEAIAWSLYGARVARSGREEIRSTYAAADDNCTVVLEFEIGQENYRLERSLVGRTERSEVILYRGSSRESAGTTETEKYVTHLLGLDWRGFVTSFLARQQELNALANLTPADRRAQLAGMLGIDRLDRAIKLVKEDRRVAEQGAELLQQQVAVLEVVRARLRQLREHVATVENQHVTLDGAWREADRKLAAATVESREHEMKAQVCSEARGRMDGARQTIRHLAQRAGELAVRQAGLEAAQRELDSIEPLLIDVDRRKAELDELKQHREAAARINQLTLQAAAWRVEIEQANRAVAELTAEQDGLNQTRAELPDDLADQVRVTEARLEETRRLWSDHKAALAADEQTVAQLTEQLESIERVGPEAVCERCRRPFGIELPEIKKHLASELAVSEGTCRKRREELIRLQERGQELKADADRLRQLDQRRLEMDLKLKNLHTRLADLQGRRQRLASQMGQLDEQLKALGAVAYDPGRLEQLATEVARLERLRGRSLELRGELKGGQEVAAISARLVEQRAQAEAEAASIESQIKVIGFDPVAFEAATRTLAEQQAAANEARLALSEAAKELEIGRREVKMKEEELERLDEIGRRLESVRTDQYYAEKLANLFGDFRKFTISRIRPRLAELSSQLMAEMTGGKYSLVELDEDYNLQVMDNGAFFGIDRFSGGEKDLASLCLRLSISLALTESAGLDRSFIILDEVFGSQDSGRRELIFEALANLKPRFPQMILITHLEELKHKVETIIEVMPQPGGWSEVRVNGGLV
jgi:exonuclease SbcC